MNYHQNPSQPYNSTIHPACKSVLVNLKNAIKSELKANFIAAYIHGSMATGDFLAESDIDIVIVVKEDIARNAIVALQSLHQKLHETLESPWGQRLELSYIPEAILRRRGDIPRDPPGEPRDKNWLDPCMQSPPRFYPFWYLDNGARKLVRSEHDNTQIVRWTLREKGIVLEGPHPETLIDPVTKNDLIEDLRNTFKLVSSQWNNRESLHSLGMQTFFVTLCCRALHCFNTGIIVSKKAASEWAENLLDKKYRNLVRSAYTHWLGDRSILFSTPADLDSIVLTMALVEETAQVLGSGK